MKVEQISVYLENKSERLSEAVRLLARGNINIRALTLADTSDFGILRLIVSDNERAVEILKEEGFTVGKTEVVAVEVPDRPGGLAGILESLCDKSVNVEYMYSVVKKKGDSAMVIFRFHDPNQAIGILQTAGITVLDAEHVHLL